MTTITFDRLTYPETLKAAGIPEAQARAHAVALDEALRDSVATKGDITILRSDIELLRVDVDRRLEASKVDVIKWVVGVAFAQSALILTLLKLFPGGHP